MRITVEYLAFLLKERYLEQLLEAWDIPNSSTRVEKVLEILPSIAILPKNISIILHPVGSTFDETNPTKRMVRLDIWNNKSTIHIFLYRDRVRLVRSTEYGYLLDKELEYSDLIHDKSYSILLSPESEMFDISSAELIAFGLELKE